MLRKLGFPICGMLFSILLLSGCTENGREYGKSLENTNYSATSSKDTQMNRAYQTQQLYGPVSHNNKKLEYSQFLSNQVNSINGVNTAIVMTTDQYAYVALMMDNTATGTKGTVKETGNQGTTRGIYNLQAPDTDAIDSNSLNTGVNNYETAIHHDLLAHRFKQQIAEKIRTLQPTVLDVYISANRDFLNKMNNYAQESWKGNSLQPFVPEFNHLVEKTFGTEQSLPDR
ncbi:YhcN/YlaJ family sporulation lipoprotein [Paenibacillus hexagrammi]|uniref:YhcN/YlaJ family sporulation lipoprotein n=1 Tax=Paenibacillus hexagrammi TaxID=2908839 RepID=A0ABY3SLQ2_9BACL|nr:YhcN/YlaJ family sporulation lipoprotein [Paenibacillus sp. YPD9-1]UJF34149.1 YhcN/YlaJ family sporulation lipoprotein [Paenibacillus sp. YPD9-1]